VVRIFYDTEFIEDGRTVDLISIGMVAEDGRELYLVNEGIEQDQELYKRICAHDWLMANVVPHLPVKADRPETRYRSVRPRDTTNTHSTGAFDLDWKDNRIVSRRFIRNSVRDFILATPNPELWAYYGAYDHVVLAQLFGRMIDLPDGVPMWTNDLKQECYRLGDPDLPKQESAEHNALADARWTRDTYAWLAVKG
jgi:hypothetical protein